MWTSAFGSCHGLIVAFPITKLVNIDEQDCPRVMTDEQVAVRSMVLSVDRIDLDKDVG